MFNRISYEAWTVVFPIVSFIVSFAIFALAVTWALGLKKSKVTQLARIPMEDEADPRGR